MVNKLISVKLVISLWGSSLKRYICKMNNKLFFKLLASEMGF